jgi:SNF2 family DNA or RNA helicase
LNYLIHPQQRAVIVPGDESLPARIPAARPLDYKGKRLWAVPYNTWETQVLRTMGYLVPSPIGTYYDWPREITQVPQPFHNQVETAAFLTLNHRAYCLNEIGTGKTLSALWAADWLMRERLVRKVLILSPLSTLERVWSDGVFLHLRERSIAVLYGSAAKRRKLFANNAFDFYVINHDAVDIIAEVKWKQKKAGNDKTTGQPVYQQVLDTVKLLRDDIDLVIIDELGAYRNGTTNRWRVLDLALDPRMWVWGMTGTPIPNAPSDAYSEMKLITPSRLPRYFTEFRQMVMQQMTDYIWIAKKDAPITVYEYMQPAIRFTRDECFDLPPCTYSTREVPLTAEQKKHYKELAQQLYTEIGEGKVTAVNEGVKMGKLIQCACGVVYDNEGVPREINAKPRIDEVREIIEQTEHKVIVFVPFTAPLLMLERELSKQFKCAVVYGDVSKAKRDTIFADFQTLSEPRVLIADAGTMSHGLTLTEAATIVWYGPKPSNDIYEQANGRITRPGQKNNQHIIHLASTEVERRLYARLRERGRLQGILLDMVQKGVAL